MKTHDSQLSDQIDDLLGQVVDEYLEQLGRGEQPDIEGYAKEHPEIASLIRNTFPALQLVGQPTPAIDRSPELEGSRNKQLGDFRLLRELGSGGMGFVYEAEQLSMGRKVAVKILPMAGALQPKSVQRFRNEVRAAASLDHPNIVPVYFVGEDRGIHYFAMQLIRGQSLAQVIQQLRKLHTDNATEHALSATEREPGSVAASGADAIAALMSEDANRVSGPSSPTQPDAQAQISTMGQSKRDAEFFQSVARLGVQAADGLQHAHDQGVLHRDIKPANLMLDVDARLYVTDFGLARIETDVAMTVTGDLVGTLRYMSPEQALANRMVVDHRSDVYSLGVTLYELLTLRPPFQAENRQELVKQITFEEPRRLRQINRSIPHELETIVLKSLEKNPEHRYASAGRLADDLRAYLEHRPIKAKPPTWLQRTAKWSRRHRSFVWSAGVSSALLLVAVVIFLTISNSFIANERNEKSQALDAKTKALAEKKAALAEKTDALAVADANLEKALEAIDQMLLRVSSELAGTSQTYLLRKSLLEEAIILCEELLKQNPTDTRVRYQLGRLFFEQALILSDLGDKRAAIRLQRTAISHFKSLRATSPADAHYQNALQRAFHHLGWHGSDVDERIKLHRQSVAISERLVAEHPEEVGYKVRLVQALLSLGGHVRFGDKIDSGAYIRRALELVESDPNINAGVVAKAHHCHAMQLRSEERLPESEQAYRNAITAYKEELRSPLATKLGAQIERRSFKDELAASYREHAQLLVLIRKPKEAERAYRESMVAFARMQADFPSAPFYQQNFAKTKLGLAKLLIQIDRTEEAREFIEANPDTAQQYATRAAIYALLNEFKNAMSDYSKAIELDGDNDSFYRSRGELYLKLGQFEGALGDFNRAVELNPKHAAACNHWGNLFVKRKRFNEAIAMYTTGLKIDLTPYGRKQRAEAYLELSQYDQALVDFSAAVEGNPADGSSLRWIAPELVARCPNKAFRDGMRALADKAIETDDNPNVRVWRAELLAAFGHDERALADYNKAIELEPKQGSWYAYRAAFYANRSRWHDALSDVAKAVEVKPGYYYRHYQHALLALAADNRATYVETCQQMLTRFAKSKQINDLHFSAWTAALSSNALQDYSPAIQLAEEAIQLELNRPGHRMALGAVLFRAGKFKEALEQLNQVASKDIEESSPIYVWYFLAMAHHQLGDPVQARKWLTQAVEQSERVFDENAKGKPVAWNRRLTLKLLRQEAETLLGT